MSTDRNSENDTGSKAAEGSDKIAELPAVSASASVKSKSKPVLLTAPKRTSELASEDRSDSNSDDTIEGPVLLTDEERRERTEWHQMLTSALCSQVVDGEKKRLKAQAESYLHAHMDLWLGCRAAIRGRTPLQEKQTLESLRNHHVDTTLRAVMEFSADTIIANLAGDDSTPESDFSAQCLAQLQKLLRRVDYVEGMYPTLHALGEAKPSYTSQLFQEKLSAITSWTNISVRIELLYKMIQRWTGSRELNLFATDSTGSSRSSSLDSVKKRVQHTPFVERLLKENGMKMIFEQKILTELDQAMISARSDMIENSDMIVKMGLPVTNRRMQELLLFQPRLLQTCLQIRLQSAENLVNLPQVQVDQLIEDIRDSLSVGCRVKRTFMQLAKPTEKWNPEVQLDSDYDTTLRSCLQTYFRLVHRKLVVVKGSAIGVRDFEILENQWPFLLEIVRDIDGGHYELVRRYCQQVRRSMRLWIRILAQKLEGPEGYDSIDSRNLGRWITKTLQDIRAPILKAQRLVRTLQNALTNATDYTFDDPLLLLAELVNTKHGLIYTGGEWESRGVYIICSKALLDNPQLAQEMLSACIVDDVMKSEKFKTCYLLIVRTDAEFNWTGSTVRPEGGTIAYQELELNPGQMRLIAPGLARLDRYRHSKQTAVARIYELNRAHNPHIQREWTLLKFTRSRQGADNPQSGRHSDVVCQGASCDLLEQVQEAFSFVSNTSSRGARFLDLKAERYVRLGLLHMSVGWCAFIAEDCMANERRTFRWAMQALEFTMSTGKNNTLQVLPREDWQLLKAQVAGCVTLMISHFDVLGNRNEDLNVKDRQKRREMVRLDEPNMLLSLDGIGANFRTHLMQRQRLEHAQQVDALRDQFLSDECRIGRVLEVTALPEDQTLRLLAASSSNITLRWNLGRYIGGGAFGAVYIGYNLDSGELMAVKEIRFPTHARRSDLGNKIVREMEVMSMLQHPNIVTYYGIEVHREKVYLFMELCNRGSLAQLVKDQGRLDENTARIFVVQMLRGMQYLHESGICHRDIKCDNTLLDENMHIKLVDFGAAKVLNQHSLAATRRTRPGREGASLTGTPMYMAPEVILGSGQSGTRMAGGGAGEALRPGFLGAQDIWALGCCVVEMVTGNPPWSHLDNEWAIMYHVVSGDPPLPTSPDISHECLRFIRRCFTRQPADRPRAADLLADEWLAPTIRN
ncbi:hypothetical protein BX667DRAFT_470397, partial [Coemansia mojavensis]